MGKSNGSVVLRGALRRLGLVVLLGSSLAGLPAFCAQRVVAVPKLDLNRYMGQWYVISRLPNKPEKRCLSDNMIIYALGDKPRSFQMGTFCTIKGGNPDDLDGNGKMDKAGSGQLKLSHLVLFSTKYWVLATGPAYEWALVGSPNHKTLWVLSRGVTLSPDAAAEIARVATAEGFDPGKLVAVRRTLEPAETLPKETSR